MGESFGPTAELTTEWALWGKRASETAYRVLECSNGTLTADDFIAIIGRYAAGTADRLPQYTVSWLPGADEAPEFVAVAIHEHAPYGPTQPAGLSRSRYDALGREIVFIRLFCVRYAQMAKHRASYAALLDVVRQQELPPGITAAPFRIQVPAPSPRLPGAAEELAEAVAVLLLTTVQVCVLDAEEVPAADRIAFIDQVMSLLPYGLRATLSASTWASPTAQDLMLRLFFASAPRDDGDRTRHVRWGQPSLAGFPDPGSEAARLYLDWLRRTGERARYLLAERTAPLRFADTDIRQMVAALPRDLTAVDTLDDLAASLAEGDSAAVRAEVHRLERYLSDPLDPADRERYRRQLADRSLLKDHKELTHDTAAGVYRILLRLAFETPLSYDSYCAIEDAVGGQPRGSLRSVMMVLEFTGFLPWLLTAKAEPDFTDEELIGELRERKVRPTDPVTAVQQHAEKWRAMHRGTVYDFAVRYLCAHDENAGVELARRGYLAETLEIIFPSDLRTQQARLEDNLRFVHGERLTRGQIRELFADPDLRPTEAFEAAVTSLAALPEVSQFVADQAAYARLRYKTDDNPPLEPRGRRWRARRPR